MKSLGDYEAEIEIHKCMLCGSPLDTRSENMKMFPNPGGWCVNGYDVKQWIYIVCDRCGYQWSLQKLGVSRF